MQQRTAIRMALGIVGVSLVAVGAALWNRTPLVSIVEDLGTVWILGSLFLVAPIARPYRSHAQHIAVGIALSSAVVGVVCIYRYSTDHVALSLSMIGVFWNLAAGCLTDRPDFLDKSMTEVYRYFKAGNAAPPTPLTKTLTHGAMALQLASIVCLFTITTW